jgi:hypothetical protein
MRDDCGPVAHMRPWLRLLVALLACGLLVQGCSLFAKQYPAPPEPLRPTTVGVIASTDFDATGFHSHLVDGRTIDLPQDSGFKAFGRTYDNQGWLVVAGTTDGGFAAALAPLGNGCWEAYSGPSSNPIVWDMGDSILFMTGIELPKAAGYHVSPSPRTVDERLAWTAPEGNAPPMSFCANDRGEIEWGEPHP